MSEFSFNHSVIDEKYNILINQELINAVRAQARVILLPFFRKISIQYIMSENEKEYPVLTELCERIIRNVFVKGEIDYKSFKEAEEIALKFLDKLTGWQKTCLGFYFCSDMSFLEKLQEEYEDADSELTLEQMFQMDGVRIKSAATRLSNNNGEMANYLVNELIHLQDIFSTEDITSWDAESISYANENFETYAGKGQVLIPIPVCDFDYWQKIIGEREEDEAYEEE
ncbi:MAG: hypothetical protein KA987_08335 [Saprospiraceae bacterium]|jgi:hypothetical protein|nr:hypothetical protein [Saprospiraceae bacterium]